MTALVAVALSAVVLATSAACLAQDNPDQRIPRPSNRGWSRYLAWYVAGLVAVIFAAISLRSEVGLWAVAPAYAVSFVPLVVIVVTHRRRVVRRRGRG